MKKSHQTKSQLECKEVKNSDRVVELLQEAIKTRVERNSVYKSIDNVECYKQHGHVVLALFPNGIEINNHSDFSRFQIIDTIVSKLLRYCNNFDLGGHDDSLKDISVYSNMLRELDELWLKESKEFKQ